MSLHRHRQSKPVGSKQGRLPGAGIGLRAKQSLFVVAISECFADRDRAVVPSTAAAIEQCVAGQSTERDGESNIFGVRGLDEMFRSYPYAERFVALVIAHHAFVEEAVRQLHREAVSEDGALTIFSLVVEGWQSAPICICSIRLER